MNLIFLLVLFSHPAYSTTTIDPAAPAAVQNYGNALALNIGSGFNINITGAGLPNVFNVSVSKAVEAPQNLKTATYQIMNNVGSVSVLSAGLVTEFTGATSPVRYTGSKLFDGMKIIFPASDPIVEFTRMILRSKNDPAADEINFSSKGRYWKILTGSASEDTVDDQHFHGGTGISDQIKHTEHEKMIELVKYADVTDRIVRSGNWSDVSIWEAGHIPQTGSKVFVAEGLTITIDGEFMTQVPFTVRIDGVIRFKTTANTGLKLRTLVVNSMGSFYMGEASDRIRPGVTSQILIADRGIRDDAARLRDPLDLDGGVIAHGKLFNMFGEEKTGHAIPIEELRAGIQQISFAEAPKGWHVNDKLVFPTTSDEHTNTSGAITNYWDFRDEDEVIQIMAISADQKTITLQSALRFNHLAPAGIRDPKDTSKLLRIPVGNLTRNAFFKSEISSRTYQAVLDPMSWIRSVGLNDLQRHGHFMVMHAQSGVLMDGAGFYDLGRTNARMGAALTVHTIPVLDAAGHVVPGTDLNTQGRYALHIHGRTGADALKNPIRISNCAITGSPKHGLVNHGGNVIATGNVTYDIDGAHFFAENGSEIGAFINNLAIGSKGPMGGSDAFLMTGAFNQKTNNGTLDAFDVGGNGFGFWMEGHGIRILDNYAFHHRSSAFAYYALSIREGAKDNTDMVARNIPYIQFQVANMDIKDADGNDDLDKKALKNDFLAAGTLEIPIQAVPVTFARNVGASSSIGLFGSYIQTSITQNSYYNKIQDSVFWANTTYGVNDRYSRRVHFQNLTLIREPSGINFARNHDYPTYGGGFGGNDHTQYIIYDQLHIEGWNSGIDMPKYGNNIVKDSFLKNRVNIQIYAPKAEDNIEGFENGDNRHITIQNIRFEELNQKGYTPNPSYDILFRGRFMRDDPNAEPDPTPWLPDRNLVDIIGQDMSTLRIGSDYIPYTFDRWYVVLCENAQVCPGSPKFSKKFTNQLASYVAVVRRTAYPTSAVIYSNPVNLHEGWNFIPVTVPGYTLDCVHDPYGCAPQEKLIMVFGDKTPPVFEPLPDLPLVIDSDHLSSGFYLMGSVIDQTGNFKTIQNFSRNFTNLTVDPDGKVRLRFSVSDSAGNTAEIVVPLTYVVNNYTITASAGAGGAISPNGAVNVSRGGSQSFTISANSGYRIADVLEDGAPVDDFGGCGMTTSKYVHTFNNVTGNHAIAATFVQNNYVLNVTLAGTGTGTVTKSPDQVNYAPGSSVQLTAVPAAGSVFSGWTVGNTTDMSESLNVTMNDNLTVTANFTLNPLADPTDAQILVNMEKVIRDHPSSRLSSPEKKIANFDLNNDGNVDAADQLMMRNIWSLGYERLIAVSEKFTNEVLARAGTRTGDPGYILEFDVDKNGSITVAADRARILFALRRPSNRTDASILYDMEKAIRDHAWGLNHDVPNPFPGFDLNSDGMVNATDQVMMRNMWTLTPVLFKTAYDKFMAEVGSRYGISSNPRYVFELDYNKDGLITSVDYLRIRTALSHGRTQ